MLEGEAHGGARARRGGERDARGHRGGHRFRRCKRRSCYKRQSRGAEQRHHADRGRERAYRWRHHRGRGGNDGTTSTTSAYPRHTRTTTSSPSPPWTRPATWPHFRITAPPGSISPRRASTYSAHGRADGGDHGVVPGLDNGAWMGNRDLCLQYRLRPISIDMLTNPSPSGGPTCTNQISQVWPTIDSISTRTTRFRR